MVIAPENSFNYELGLMSIGLFTDGFFFQPDLSVEATKYRLEYENLPYFCLFCGRLTHVCFGCELHSSGVVKEKRYRRSRTLIKDIFCIDPDGELNGKVFGLTSPKKGWVMKVPESQLAGSKCAREEEFVAGTLHDPSMGDIHLPDAVAEGLFPTRTRWRVDVKEMGSRALKSGINVGNSISEGKSFGASVLQHLIQYLRVVCPVVQDAHNSFTSSNHGESTGIFAGKIQLQWAPLLGLA